MSTAPVRVSTDDQVYRVKAVWLGPVGWSWPFHARYLAWATWFAVFPVIWGLMWLVGIHQMVPVWPFCLAVLATKALMQIVDHDLSLRALRRTAMAEVRSFHRHKPHPMLYTDGKVDIR